VLFTLVALFVAAPSTWGSTIVDHGGGTVETHAESITAPQTLPPSHGSHLHTAAHTLVVVVLIAALGVAVLGCTRRRAPRSAGHGSSPALVWVQRRGPPLPV
jgi:H+/Cl- antiporter ClcA